MSRHLLSRQADAIYWLARYMERIENLARILDVNRIFSHDSSGLQDWRSLLYLFADFDRFEESGREIEPENVLQFYTLDRDNWSSIVSLMGVARDNARRVRPLVSREVWTQLNTFFHRLNAYTAEELADDGLARFCDDVRQSVQTHTGILEGTFSRDAAWRLYRIGRMIERADQTTRLIDVKYHVLLPSVSDVGTTLDSAQWQTLLHSAAAFHAMRRRLPYGFSPQDAAGFLLFDPEFPRSVRFCIGEAAMRVAELRARYGFPMREGGASALSELLVRIDSMRVADVVAFGMHEFLDDVQLQLIAVSEELRAGFGAAADEAFEQPQSEAD